MKLLSMLALSVLSLPVFAQQTCYVDMVDRYNRVVATYTAWDDPRVCQEGMKQCRKAIRLEPHLGGVDCIREGSQQPQPQPIPVPVPQPQPPRPQPPRPHPGPGPGPGPIPGPQPGPGWGSIEVAPLILDISSAEYSAEHKTKLLNEAILLSRSHVLTPFVQICNGTRTWAENVNCLVSGVQRAPREAVHEQEAIELVAQSCAKTSTWANEKSCFTAALKNGRLQTLSYYAQSCQQMWDAESSAKCFRNVFGTR